MAVIKWRDSYNTGIDQFDKEHHKILELIDIMFMAIRDKSDKEITRKACNDVLSYTQYHFANEEQAMQEANYPELEEHIAEHVRLKNEAVRFQTIIDTNFPEGVNDFYRFLREWLVNHIEGCDMKYGPYLKSPAVKQ
jgi:hemerythrin-like metal-binding protein